METILRTLMDHFAECQDYWNKLVENDADYIKQENARARMSGVEECVQLAMKVRDATIHGTRKREYNLPNGQVVVFEYDHNGIGKVTVESMDLIMGMMSEIVRCGECKHMMPNGKCDEFADGTIRPSASDYCSAGERCW